jgi:hypothetical protein
LDALLACLVEAGVELIVVGGTAAVIHGAPTTTIDLDIVPRRSDENLARLLTALQQIDARPREKGRQKEAITAVDLASPHGQLRLSTSMGPLDCLSVLHDGRGYEELIAHTETVTDGGIEMRIIDLPTLIEIKSSTGRARDKLLVPLLIAVLEQRQQDE